MRVSAGILGHYNRARARALSSAEGRCLVVGLAGDESLSSMISESR